jgi:hypothetical protein
MALEDLQKEPMMAHLLKSLEDGQDIGHYGRLVFIMVSRHFLAPEEVVAWLAKDPDCDQEKARALLEQVEARDYNPPKRERILQWMEQQGFPICPDPQDRTQCNVYRNLQFPGDVYGRIQEFYRDREPAGKSIA